MRWIALTLVNAFLGIACAGFAPWLSSLFALGGIICVGLWVRDVIASRVDPYSITALKQFEEREEVRQLLENEAKCVEDAEVVCPGCLEPYPARLRACPRCRTV